jgi:microcin C transport system permease protein
MSAAPETTRSGRAARAPKAARTWIRLSPDTAAKFRRFRRIRRGWWSLLALAIFSGLSLLAELLVNSRPLVVHYQGRWIFPTYGAIHTGREFGLDYDYEVKYPDLRPRFAAAGGGDWMLLPLVPYDPIENCYDGQTFKPRPPDAATHHWLGTDQLNRDILARLLYGYRSALLFSTGFVGLTYLVGVSLGCAMAYWGGWFDLVGQRLLEVWSMVPFLFVVIILRSVITPTPGWDLLELLGIVALFSWVGMSYYMRSATYREKAREYVAAAQVLGAGAGRIVFVHILPNTLATLVTFIPFTVAAAISSLTALDFLGFGLPPPTPSWGELLHQGTGNLNAPWIVVSAFSALSVTLILVTFVGEAIREAFDPKRHTIYQ